MQYLAKVSEKSLPGKTTFKLLARQSSDCLWQPTVREKLIEADQPVALGEGALVLLTLDGQAHVLKVEEADVWILQIVSQYLSQGITPTFLQQEAERAEQWRQSLTLKDQDVRRRSLETAARRDEMQELEKQLGLESEALEHKQSQLQEFEQKLRLERERLEQKEAQLKTAEQKLRLEQASLEQLKAQMGDKV